MAKKQGTELSSQGRSQPEIARILQISQPTVNRDIQYLRQEAKENIRKYIDEKLPEEYKRKRFVASIPF